MNLMIADNYVMASNKWGDLIFRKYEIIFISSVTGKEYIFLWADVEWAVLLFFSATEWAA